MSRFTPQEIEYLKSNRLGRMATIDQKGDLHVVPVRFRYNAQEDTIDIGGRDIVPTKKYRDALSYGRMALVVDDVIAPGHPRFVEVRGKVQAVREGGKQIDEHFVPDILRLTPTYIVSMGINDQVSPAQGQIHYDGRKVT